MTGIVTRWAEDRSSLGQCLASRRNVLMIDAEQRLIRQRSSTLMLLSVACVLCLSGCWGKPTPQSGGESSAKNAGQPVREAVSRTREIVKDWPTPQVALVLTGEQQGYMEPCGCSETQSGGISRRADLFRQLRDEKNWNVVGLDLGDTMKRSRQQDRIKFGVLHEALTDMGYRAMTLGPADLKLQVDFLYSTAANIPTESDAGGLPFVSANVVFYDSPDLGAPLRSQILDVNGCKIGVTGFLGEGYLNRIFPEGSNAANDLLRVDPAVEALKPVVEDLKQAGCDLLVLLAQAPRGEVETVVKAFPEFQVCLAGGGPEDPTGVPTKIGSTLVVEAGRKGKYAGVLAYYPDAENEKFRFELIDLDKARFQRTDAMEAHMAYYQELLRDQMIVENERAVPHPSGNEFVGSQKCGECHTKAFAQWKKTKHAHATETLVSGDPQYKETEWINRIHDPECLACHAVGWAPQDVYRYESGFLSLEKTPHLTGQGCENCHGPGSHHTQLELTFRETRQTTPEISASRNAMKVELARAERDVCRKCHDFENSPKFDFVKYWEKVVHRGKD